MSNNNLPAQKISLTNYLNAPAVVGKLSEKLGLEEAKKFRAALSSAVSTNPVLLTECDPASVVSSALTGHSLGLPPSPQLGYYYLVPYNDKKRNCKVAQFQIGYKGYIQLAMRSGYYRKLNVTEIKQGEFVSFNQITEELKVNLLTDPIQRESAETIGYCGYFEYVNGFSKMIFWTRQQMEVHADKYSKAYNLASDKLLKAGKIPQGELWKYSSFWYADFDSMAKKTILRQLLSKWGSMSVDMQTAYEEDIKADSMSFNDAQGLAQHAITEESGSEIIDTEFETINEEPDPATETKKQEQLTKLKQPKGKKPAQTNAPFMD